MVNDKQLLEFARKLKNNPDATEVELRCTSHTAYYALFHAAKGKAETLGFKDSGEGSIHKQLRDFYALTNQPRLRGIKSNLAKLCRRRVEADYKLHTDFISKRDDIKQDVRTAALCINDISS